MARFPLFFALSVCTLASIEVSPALELPANPSAADSCEAYRPGQYRQTIFGDIDPLDPLTSTGNSLEEAKNGAVTRCIQNAACKASPAQRLLCETAPECRYSSEQAATPPSCAPAYCDLEECDNSGWCISAITYFDEKGAGRAATAGELRLMSRLGYRLDSALRKYIGETTYTAKFFKPTRPIGAAIYCVAQGTVACEGRCTSERSADDAS